MPSWWKICSSDHASLGHLFLQTWMSADTAFRSRSRISCNNVVFHVSTLISTWQGEISKPPWDCCIRASALSFRAETRRWRANSEPRLWQVRWPGWELATRLFARPPPSLSTVAVSTLQKKLAVIFFYVIASPSKHLHISTSFRRKFVLLLKMETVIELMSGGISLKKQ